MRDRANPASDDPHDIVDRCRSHEAPGMRTFASDKPFVISRARGSWIDAPDGRYLDLSGFHGVANIGHAHPAVVRAVSAQAQDLIHCPTSFPTRVRAEFYETLASLLPAELNAILPALSGASANENALLIAKARRPRGEIVAFSGGYHGRSIGTAGLSGKTRYRLNLGLPASAQFVPFPYPSRMGERATDQVMDLLETLAGPGGGVEEVAAVLVEPVQGNGGVVVPPVSFIARLREFCTRTGALLVCDEVQSGGGRTGRMWAFEHSEIVPDIVTVGKSIGGGLPVAATVARRELVNWLPDSIAGTFIANNLNFAASIAAMKVIRDEKLGLRSELLGRKYLDVVRQRLTGVPGIAEVRGLGLWIAVEFTDAAGAPDGAGIARALRERRVIIGTGGYSGRVAKIAPALNIDEEVLSAGVEEFVAAIEEACGARRQPRTPLSLETN